MAALREHTAIVRNICLSLLAIAILAFGVAMENGHQDVRALCGGRRYAVSAVPNGFAPYIELSADGVTGPFLLDYGTTRSSLSASAFAAADGSVRKAAISLPDIETGDFDIARYDLLLQPEKGQLGVIGADFLSQLSAQFTGNAVFFGASACHAEALRARGLVPIAQNGFFSSDLSTIGAGLPNVPVVFLRFGAVRTWAQIDTGYDDVVYAHSVDVNEALYARLIESGIKLERVSDINVWTCEGSESRHVYAVKDGLLAVENEQAKPIAQTENFRLILKPANGCGGIGEMTVPAAQLGASFLQLFGTAVFDPKSGMVWLQARKGQSAPSGFPDAE
jgi:hypothetical protein